MTGNTMHLIAAFAAGLVLGTLYLGALWLVLRRLPRARHPLAWLLGSAALRIGLLLAGWYAVSGGRWEALLASVAGFLVVRIVATRIVRAGIRPASAAQGQG